TGGHAARAAAGPVRPAPPRPRAVPRVPLQRVAGPVADSVPRAGRLADQAGLPRRAVAPGLHGAGEPAAGGPGALLARPAVLQAGPARRRRGVAPGLLVLDADGADAALDVLDRAGRRDARERLHAVPVRQPPLAAAADHRAGRRHGSDP